MATKIGFDTFDIPDKGKIGWLIEIEQEKVGSQWKTVKVYSSTFTKQNLLNIASDDTLRWFRGIGGYEKRDMTYTPYGYLPSRVTSINPSRDFRHIREFYYSDRGQSYKYHLAKYKAEMEKAKTIRKR